MKADGKLQKWFRFQFEKLEKHTCPRTLIWIYRWEKVIYYPRKWTWFPYIAFYLFPQYKPFRAFLITMDYTGDDYKDEKEYDTLGLGIAFWYKGHFCRSAIRFDKNIKLNDLEKLWKKLAKAISKPEAPESKVAFESVLSGKEITIEDIKHA